jgi:hypothetical protein
VDVCDRGLRPSGFDCDQKIDQEPEALSVYQKNIRSRIFLADVLLFRLIFTIGLVHLRNQVLFVDFIR